VTSLRRAVWIAGSPARAAIVAFIRLYRLTLSSSLGGQCRFYPSCSHYAEDAVRLHGVAKGSLLAAWRIARCGPFTAGGVDHVPVPLRQHGQYDGITHGAAS
jgi:putative membrane protein insertion efficiency factor